MSRRIATAALIVLGFAIAMSHFTVRAQNSQSDEVVRHAKVKVWPVYPELAHKMNITGTVKISVTVAPNGSVKEAHVVGGHPLLANEALMAAKKWRFEAGPSDTPGVILDFKFDQQ